MPTFHTIDSFGIQGVGMTSKGLGHSASDCSSSVRASACAELTVTVM